jgi:hypothetical protein
MKAAPLKHEFQNLEAAMKDAVARGDDEAVELLKPVERAGRYMLAQQIEDTIDSNWIEAFRDARSEAVEKRGDLDQWLYRSEDDVVTRRYVQPFATELQLARALKPLLTASTGDGWKSRQWCSGNALVEPISMPAENFERFSFHREGDAVGVVIANGRWKVLRWHDLAEIAVGQLRADASKSDADDVVRELVAARAKGDPSEG